MISFVKPRYYFLRKRKVNVTSQLHFANNLLQIIMLRQNSYRICKNAKNRMYLVFLFVFLPLHRCVLPLYTQYFSELCKKNHRHITLVGFAPLSFAILELCVKGKRLSPRLQRARMDMIRKLGVSVITKQHTDVVHTLQSSSTLETDKFYRVSYLLGLLTKKAFMNGNKRVVTPSATTPTTLPVLNGH